MTKFKTRKIDTSAREAEIFREGESYGKFMIRYVDFYSTAFKLQLLNRNKRLSAQDRNRINNQNTAADIDFARSKNMEFFIDVALEGWDIVDEAGKSVAFNKAEALAYFTAEPWLFEELESFSMTESNFVAVTKDEIVKN